MATRFYLSSSSNAHREPGFSGWTRTTEGLRRRMSPQKDGSTIQSTTFWANGAAAADESALARQFVSDGMAAGIAFVTTDTIKCQVLCKEAQTNDNINRQPITVKVYSEDGQTLRATLLALAHIGPNTTEWLNTGPRNKTVADGDVLTTGYTTVAGDRLVIELGGQVSAAGGVSVTGTQWYGADGASDLGENETDTNTALNPWFEISRTITFLDPDFTTQQNQFPDIKPPVTPPIAVGLTVAAGLLLTTLAPTPPTTRSPYYAGRQPIPIVRQVEPAPNLLPLLAGGEVAPPFKQTDWPIPPPLAPPPIQDCWQNNLSLDPSKGIPFQQSDWPIPKPLPLTQADVYQPLAQFSLRPSDGCPAGPYFATTVVNDASVGDVAWTAPENARVSDDLYSSVVLVSQTAQRLDARGFNFNIAPGKIIAGIKVEVEGKTSVLSEIVQCRIIKGGIEGSTTRSQTFDTTEQTLPFPNTGAQNDLWAQTWAPADVNASDFGVKFSVFGTTENTIFVDSIRITIYCHDPLPLNPPTSLVLQQIKASIQSDLPPNLLITTLAIAEQTPFKQTDWPNPLAVSPCLPRQDPQLFLNLLLAPTGDKPFLQSDWPQLKPQAPLSIDQSPSLLETTLAPEPGEKPFSQSDWPLFPAKTPSKVPQHSSYRLSFGPTETAKPFLQNNWPRLVSLPDLYQEFNYLNLALGTIPFRQDQWPILPKRERPRIENPPNLLTTTLATVPAAMPFNQDDWPTPKLIRPLHTLDPLNVTILLPPGPVPFVPVEWPLPKQVQTLTGCEPLNLTIQLPVAETPPFAQLQWSQLWITQPVRQGDAPNLLLTTLAPSVAAPFSQTDWPTPKLLERTWQDHGRGQPLPILAQISRPFVQSIWQLPAVRTLFAPTVTEQRLLTLAPEPGPLPFNQDQWPLPPPTDKSKLNVFMLTENVVLLTTPPPPVATGTRKKRKWRRSST